MTRANSIRSAPLFDATSPRSSAEEPLQEPKYPSLVTRENFIRDFWTFLRALCLTLIVADALARAVTSTLQTEPANAIRASPPPPILPTCTLLARNFPAGAAQKFTKRQAGAVLHSTSVTLSSALRGFAAAHVSNSCRVERVETTADAMDVYFCFAPSARARERDDHRNLCRCYALATPSQLVSAAALAGYPNRGSLGKRAFERRAAAMLHSANRTAIVGAALAADACERLSRSRSAAGAKPKGVTVGSSRKSTPLR